MANFEISLAARVPSASGPPTLAEVDRLVTSSFSYVDELNRPGSGSFQCKIGSLSDVVKSRLADLAHFPGEVWVYVDSVLRWAGEIRTLGIQDQTVTLNCVGLLGYLARMGITDDLIFSGQDQLEIARTLVNAWQSKGYAHYGISVPNSGLSGVLRERTYLQKDLKNVLSALDDLGAVINGFDYHVDPQNRALVLSYPRRGANLGEAVVLDERSVDSANVAQSVAPEDVTSDFAATSSAQGADGSQISLYSYMTNSALQATFGRSWQGQSFSDISEQSTLDSRGVAYLAPRGRQLLQPGVTANPNPATGVVISGFNPGDSIGYAYDAGLGLQSGVFRVNKVSVNVDDNGKQQLGVEFV